MIFIKIFEAFHENQLKELKKYDKTYLLKDSSRPKYTIYDSNMLELSRKELINYNINNIITNETPYGIFLYPDDKLKEIIYMLNNSTDIKIPDIIYFYITINKDKLNEIDFEHGIPETMQKTGFWYKLYKLIIKRKKYITSNIAATAKAYSIWYDLMLDDELYCFTSNKESGVIHKDISDGELSIFLSELKKLKLNIEFDDELTKKIIQLYGNMDIYKQENK